ncbi:uncharacterized protein L969DRAFT_338279 [Mixia osmundae IAM 14324]|uniref:Uncharacterized protein n=1 Tax=Mixia osmundae (strain CBS 9802 / IAM 14324 / JCM 22182 / KY 12970) TaxID=764103 RepID=G7E644_MIXOS|nr:uncharacterized protein L969DRAFT_338279 [Mixia osmundae IAM 14324]KEI40543.1 hypothetical protein L969DRAFT_338279 [Mixia osmundae IAM 14324]GAA98304.1 hypothetical protein E5Q_04988 [Mixia osmundae IAM 14324]
MTTLIPIQTRLQLSREDVGTPFNLRDRGSFPRLVCEEEAELDALEEASEAKMRTIRTYGFSWIGVIGKSTNLEEDADDDLNAAEEAASQRADMSVLFRREQTDSTEAANGEEQDNGEADQTEPPVDDAEDADGTADHNSLPASSTGSE